MAEQVDQNVVIDPLLASASAPADVAANPITTATADDGNDTIHQKESATRFRSTSVLQMRQIQRRRS